MATDIVQSLFGVTPEMYQQSQQARADQQALQYAQLTPFQQANYAIGRGANMLGGAIGGALGSQDPQLALITARQQISKQINYADPASIAKGVDMLSQAGDTQGAMMLADVYRKAQSEMALAQQRVAEKKTPEEKNAEAYARSVAEPGTPQYNQLYQTTLQGLISKEKPELTTEQMKNAKAFALQAGPEGSAAYNAEFNTRLEQFTTKPELRPVIKEIGVAKTPGQEAVYTYQVGNGAPQQIIFKTVDGKQTIVPFSGGVDRTTSKTDIGVKLPEGQSEFLKRLSVKDADRVDAAITLRDNAVLTIKSLNKLASLPDSDLISGQFATGRVGATNLLSTLGLVSPTDVNRLAKSQEYQKVAGDVILQTLGGKLGSGFSNADREFIQGLIPQLETNPNARRQLISFMQAKNQEIVAETTRLETYARDKNGLKGFEPNIPISVAPSQPRPYSGLTDEQLAARIRAAQAQQPK
jgi:hypothetical protein